MKKNKQKNKITKIFFVFAILVIFFSSLHPIFAQYKNQEKIPGASTQQTEFIPYLKDIINFGFAALGILALFMLIIGAYQYLMAAGNIGKIDDAKDTIGSALLGLILGLCAWIILEKINPDLVKMRAITQISGVGGMNTQTAPGGSSSTPIPSSYSSNAPADLQQKAKDYAAKNNVPESVAMRMLSTESGGVNGLTSSKGAAGLLQLMPGTAADLGVTDSMNVDQNLDAGYRYANQMYNKYGDWGQALAAYNWGQGNMDAYLKTGQGLKGQPMPTETIKYVNGIMGGCSFCPT